jgi:hypothetical protein
MRQTLVFNSTFAKRDGVGIVTYAALFASTARMPSRSEVIYRAKTADELSKMETFFIVLHQSHKVENGYNMTLGGEGTVGRIISERTRQLWSEQRKGRPVTAQQLKNLALGHHRPKK